MKNNITSTGKPVLNYSLGVATTERRLDKAKLLLQGIRKHGGAAKVFPKNFQPLVDIDGLEKLTTSLDAELSSLKTQNASFGLQIDQLVEDRRAGMDSVRAYIGKEFAYVDRNSGLQLRKARAEIAALREREKQARKNIREQRALVRKRAGDQRASVNDSYKSNRAEVVSSRNETKAAFVQAADALVEKLARQVSLLDAAVLEKDRALLKDILSGR